MWNINIGSIIYKQRVIGRIKVIGIEIKTSAVKITGVGGEEKVEEGGWAEEEKKCEVWVL
jgi:hypothetical protein